ncbi:MAG: methionine biosynthesis protein MetW [Rhodocyclaceae bacterium]
MNAAAVLERPDFRLIASWVAPGSRVLDLGCGDGALLRILADTRGVRGYGVEIDPGNVLASVRTGINVIQSDLETGLSGFRDQAFDQVILSLTLQAVRHIELLVGEMLRVGREAIVTFPNFGYWKLRWQILRGRMPVSSELPYEWYDTPNIHLCTIRDFEVFCRSRGYEVINRNVLHEGAPIRFAANLRGSIAVFRIRRRDR